MLLRVCEKNHPSIVYATNELPGQCLVCHYLRLLDDAGIEIRELKEEVHRQTEQLGRPTLIAVINGEMLEVCQKMIAISDLWVPVAVPIQHEDEANALYDVRERMLAAIANAKREVKKEKTNAEI